MRVTLGPPNHLVTIVVSVAIALSVLLLAVATLGATTNSRDDRTAVNPAPDAATQDAGVVNPWAAGDAAALQELADLGRAHLNGCP
jgi:hypothetical protein